MRFTMYNVYVFAVLPKYEVSLTGPKQITRKQNLIEGTVSATYVITYSHIIPCCIILILNVHNIHLYTCLV